MRKGKKITSFILAASMILGLNMYHIPSYGMEVNDVGISTEEGTEDIEETEEEITEDAEISVDGAGIVSYGENEIPLESQNGIVSDRNAEDELMTATEQVMTGQSEVVQLDSTYANLNSLNNEIFYREQDHGLYFLNYDSSYNYVLTYYDGNTYEPLYTLKRSPEIFYAEDGLYSITYSTSSLDTPITEGEKTYDYSETMTVKKFDFATKTESSIQLDAVYSVYNWGTFIAALGVDDSGRIYVATNENQIWLFDNTGKYLSKCDYTDDIYNFWGFDSTNGNFYYTGYVNWEYWGYDHAMTALKAGNVSADNQIAVKDKNLAMLYQSVFFEHIRPVSMLSDKYLGVLNTFSQDVLYLLDSNSYDYNDYTEQSTSINMIDSSVSVTPLNISNLDAIKIAVSTSPSVYENNKDVSSAGTRSVILGDSLLVKTDSQTITEYNITNREKVIAVTTKYPVYNLFVDGNTVIVLEKEGDTFYLEKIDWTMPRDYTVMIPSNMTAGDSGQITCSNGSSFEFDYTYTSSDASIVSVDADGLLNAWKAGSATITVEDAQNHVTKKFTIRVTNGTKGAGTYSLKELGGEASTTIHLPNANGRYGSVTTAYLNQLGNGDYERVEWTDSKVVVETYNMDGNGTCTSQKKISPELQLFGGYYKGDGYNYLVFGQGNLNESDETEVIRVVKYDANWNRVAACSIYGANTYYPFDAGGLDMVETGGKLYVHTCHTMYKSSDGYHHQANCTFVIDEADMTLADSYYDTMNISYGYVSHSFNQRICTDGDYLYRVDLGDAYPRGIAYTKTSVDKAINRPTSYGTAHPIAGTVGNNYTGYNLGGVELSSKNTVITGSGLKNDVGNVWITVVNNTTGEVVTNWITNYAESDAINVMQPKLVKLANDNQFLILWEEYAGSYYKRTYTTKYALMNADGTLASKIYTTPLALSACNPILNAKGNVCWYVTNNAEPVFVEINPYACDSVASQSAGDTTFAGSGNGSGNGNDDEGGNDIGNGNNNNDGDVEKADNIALSGIAHVQSFGDKSGNWKDGTLTLGTTGLAKRLESVTINLVNDTGLTGGLQYRVHRQTYGWTNWVTDGKPAGTVGEAKRLEAIQLKLTGELAEKYSIRYRVHIQSYGWNQGWQYDGALAGTTGEAKRLEALEIQIVPKTVAMGVTYRVHRQTYGWEPTWTYNGGVSGTVGQSKRLEGITLALTGSKYSGSITYSTHVQTYGWMNSVSDGWMSGTSGQAKRLEAIKIALSGEVETYYDVYYRVHAQSYGWLGWAKNGNPAGTAGYAKRLEAIQVVLVPKGSGAPSKYYGGVTSSDSRAYVSK